MNILGISAFYHDSAACLVQDGQIAAAAQEERFTRKKHDFRFPTNAIHFCLEQAGLDAQALDLVAFYDAIFEAAPPERDPYLAALAGERGWDVPAEGRDRPR